MIVPLEQIPYVDYPEIRINDHERTEMPFRYVKDAQGEPIMPDVSILRNDRDLDADQILQGMMDLIKKDADKGVDDLF